MLALTQIPRGSNKKGETGNLKKVTAFLKETAEELGCETYVDKGENLIIRKKATPGYEDKPVICFQGHMDMVCQKNDDVTIDFYNDPIIPRIDGEYLKATGTSLGGDDGAGVATCFAILEDNTMPHGPIEVLITRDEEVGLVGASQLEAGILKAKYMINVDSEEMNAVCIGCAGSFTIEMTMETSRVADSSLVNRRLILNNFIGGHSGCDIHLGRAHPLLTLGRLLKAVDDLDIRMVSVECGTARNAIPRKCVATVAVPKDKAEMFDSRIRSEFAHFHHEYELIEKTATFSVEPVESAVLPCDLSSTHRFINFVNVYPFGVQRYSPESSDIVETSVNCGIAQTLDNGSFLFTSSVRSSSQSQIDYMYTKIDSLCSMCGLTISEKMGAYPGWEPNLQSPITKSMVAAFEEVTGKTPRVYAIHAGLECGLFLQKYPHLDCSSIGPDLNFPHSPDERLLISSVKPMYEVLCKCMQKLYE
jgi:dipeptidase D